MNNPHNKIIIGINACRARSGGAYIHLKNILNYLDKEKFNIHKIHIWSHKKLLNTLDDKDWIIKHNPSKLESNIVAQVFWEKQELLKQLLLTECSILFNIDAGSLCRFKPMVTMSRDMLSYEPKEIVRFGFLQILRLIVLRYVQNLSLQNSHSVIFLTKYAGNKIQQYTGKLKNVSIINHGLGKNFKSMKKKKFNPNIRLKCIYISNVFPYKHQAEVIDGVNLVKKQGYDIKLELVGIGQDKLSNKILKKIRTIDPKNKFIEAKEFQDHKIIPNLIDAADIFIFASSCENMPNTLVEGMSMQIPIICSNYGPMPEVLEDGGLYFDPEKPKELEKCILNLIKKPDLADRLAKKAKQISAKYSWEKCSNDTFSLIKNIVEKK
ncbi:glycosyltransferase [Candidatus Pelagibacter sp.]|nr:glycosyltransferase [Candidatus Pelagibacter sp.]